MFTRSKRVLLALATTAAVGAASPAAGAFASPDSAGPSAAAVTARDNTGIADAARQAYWQLSVYRSTRDPQDYAMFRIALAVVAERVADDAGIDVWSLLDGWVRADEEHQLAVVGGLTQVGVPYHYNAASPDVALDCSGFTMTAWRAAGVGLPHQSRQQINTGHRLPLWASQPGDLVYRPGHVMMFLGAGDLIVHAPHSGTVVSVKRLDGGSVVVADPS